MLTIIKANFLTNRSVLAWFSIMCTLIFLIAYVLNGHFSLITLCFAWMIMAMFLQTDEKNKINGLYCSLPLTRTRIVKSRYLALLVSFLTALVFSLTMLLILNLIPIEGTTLRTIGFNDIIAAAVPLALAFAAVLPFYFKWGYNRGLTPAFIMVGLITAAVSWGLNQYVAMKLGNQVLKNSAFEFTPQGILNLFVSGYMRAYHYFGHVKFMIVICIITAIVVWASMKLSIKIFARKDL